ncbi:uncharacterized protein SPSK_10943 [Sporothrix schenckii 1099-18]|uniref:Uncharacterized protein n=1 Tax=Sporothrix schenckii 1099-18 TaxID=1397361 RepID=A0A0F2M9S5_SPOSC|nr:uncharacterized protein SPSK_10943 [Sporothrix schenckii 1099-18]KJR84916.1 hypothetical protein SPSK_10943 [Sporothrix schenckii 1099-18]
MSKKPDTKDVMKLPCEVALHNDSVSFREVLRCISRGGQGPACFHKGEKALIGGTDAGAEVNQWGCMAIPQQQGKAQ